MIELRKINRHFKNGNESNHILKDIDIHIDEGEFIAIMGPSGSGKSTLISWDLLIVDMKENTFLTMRIIKKAQIISSQKFEIIL